MEIIDKHILNIDDIRHVLHEDTGFYVLILKDGHKLTNIMLTVEGFAHLATELGVSSDSEYPHTDVTFDPQEGHFLTTPDERGTGVAA